MNVYDLSRIFWDYAFENPEKIKPNHIAMYFFAIEHCNRLGWKEKFGFPTTMVMDAISIKSYNTYIKTLNELVEYGFIKMIERSKNQYSANIIALSKNDKANDKALDKALIKHVTKQVESIVQSTSESTVQSIDSIDKPIYNYTNIQVVVEDVEADEAKICELKNILKTKKEITMDRIMKDNNISKDQLFLKIEEFVDKKVSWQDDKWRNDGAMVKNFEFWIKMNPQVINTFKSWSKKEFWERVKAIPGKVSEETRREFFDHYSMLTENGKMRFQTYDAWETITMLKKWLKNKQQFAK